MLDVLNEQLNEKGEEPIAFDSDCREGICGMCGLMINGEAHGPEVTTTCQLHMRSFNDGDDDHHRAVAGGPVPGAQGPRRRPRRLRPDHPVRRLHLGQHRLRARRALGAGAEGQRRPAFDAATCIGCGACVAACPNGSASLFLGAKITHLGELPQGQPERDTRVVNMVGQHDHEGFGGCTNIGECTAACPKEIPLDVISQLNKDLRTASPMESSASSSRRVLAPAWSPWTTAS
jgi:succinate dehydrogenase / fumarate reductase iron-sulfur subunit